MILHSPRFLRRSVRNPRVPLAGNHARFADSAVRRIALVNGIFALVAAARAPKGSNGRGATVFLGLLSAAAGLRTFLYPGLTVISLLSVIAAWAIVTGIFEIAAAIQLRRQIKGGWMLLLSGVVSIAFGMLLILMPGAGILSLIWLIGAYAILFGVLLVASAIWLKSAAPQLVAPAM